jgi:hypothetical protein
MNTKIRLGIVTLVALTVLLTTLSFQRVSLAATTEEAAVSRALLWLRTQQQANGSIPSAVGGAYNGTAQAVLAIAAGNQDPNAWLSSNNQSPMGYLASQSITQTDTITETGTTAWLTLAVVAANDNPYNLGGVNLVERLQSYYDPATGQYGLTGDVPAQALAMMALSAAVTETQAVTQTVPVTATELLKSWQDTSGGWGYIYPCSGLCSPDVDNTALVIQALVAAGEPVDSTVIVSATNFMKTEQGDDGGFQSWGTSNANSTAWGTQAVIAAGQDPTDAEWTKNGNTPVSFLLSLQASDGHFEYSDPPPGWSADLVLTTIQAVPALAGKPLPLRGRYVAVKKGLRWMQTQQQADGSIPNTVSGAYNGTNQAVLAVVAGGEDPLAWDSSGPGNPDLIGYLKSQAATEATAYVTQTTACALTILSAEASGQDPTNFGGVNLVTTLTTADYNSSTGQYGSAGSVTDQAWSVIALKSISQAIPVTATELLKSWQDPGGGWGYIYPCTGFCTPDADNTALVIEALVAAGEPVDSTTVVSATNFMKSQQGDDGGFQSWGASNANSTAWGTQAVIAALEDPQGANWSQDSKTPWYYLMQLQDDVGRFQYSDPPPGWGADLVLTTIQAVPALAGKPFPYLDEMWIGTAQVEVNLLNSDFYATALYAQDLNSNGTAQVRYRPVGGAWSGWLDMTRVKTRADAAFVRTVGSLDLVSYEFEFQLADSDGTAQGATSQTVEASQLVYYFPIISKNWTP